MTRTLIGAAEPEEPNRPVPVVTVTSGASTLTTATSTITVSRVVYLEWPQASR